MFDKFSLVNFRIPYFNFSIEFLLLIKEQTVEVCDATEDE